MTKLNATLAIATCLLTVSNVYTVWLLEGHETRDGVGRRREPILREQPEQKVVAQLAHDPPSVVQAAGRSDACSCSDSSLIARNNSALLAALARARGGPTLSLEQREILSRGRFGWMFRELELPAEQAETLLRVLATQEERAADASRTTASAAERSRLVAAQKELDQAEIQAVLGTDKAAKLERLKEAQSARAELRRVRDDLEDMGEPLSETQYAALASAARARPLSPPPARVAGEPPDDGVERLRTWFSERDRKILDDAAAVLTPEQQQRLEERQSLTRAMSLSRPAMYAGAGQAGAGE